MPFSESADAMMGAYFGEICALLTAVSWAFALIFFKRCGESIPPTALNLFKNCVGLLLMLVSMGCLWWFAPEQAGSLTGQSTYDLLILAFSGVIGIAIADTIFFAALNRLGVGLVAIVDCLYSPFVILIAYFYLPNERLLPLDYIGALLILSAVFISSRHAPPPNRTRRQVLEGVLLGALAMALMAWGIVMVKPIIDPKTHDFPLLWAAIIRLGAGTLVLAAGLLCTPVRRVDFAVFKPRAIWRSALPGAVLGTYISLLLWIAGFKWAASGKAALLNQTSTIFAILLATLLLKEAFSGRKALALLLAVAGASLVLLHSSVS
ncbi:MAG: hypothetical protein HJJLKODD_02778 [Phycisphaerae bacterium]|nr:hypothetical protein [Phycisphaerae bacterium]